MNPRTHSIVLHAAIGSRAGHWLPRAHISCKKATPRVPKITSNHIQERILLKINSLSPFKHIPPYKPSPVNCWVVSGSMAPQRCRICIHRSSASMKKMVLSWVDLRPILRCPVQHSLIYDLPPFKHLPPCKPRLVYCWVTMKHTALHSLWKLRPSYRRTSVCPMKIGITQNNLLGSSVAGRLIS